MKHEILASGELKITANEEERSWIAELLAEHEAGEKGLSEIEAEALESLIANSELEWLPEGSTGDLTSAPMLGIVGPDQGVVTEDIPENFGIIPTSCDTGMPIIARWAYMDYQVQSFLTPLLKYGGCVWEGGYAEGSVVEEKLPYPKSDWQYEVQNGDTVLGYEEWVEHRKEADAEPERPAVTSEGSGEGRDTGSVRRAKILALAREKHEGDGGDGDAEFDDDAKVSESDDNGAYVQAWVWVSFVGTELDKDTHPAVREMAANLQSLQEGKR